MWHYSKNTTVLTVIIGDSSVYFIFGQKVYKKSYAVFDYSFVTSPLYELQDGIIYNFSFLKNALHEFIQKQSQDPSFIAVIVDNKQVIHNFVVSTQPISTLTSNAFIHKHTIHSHYIGPCQDTDHLFCTCTITHPALLQCQLLVQLFRIPLLGITCSMQPLLYAYRGCKGSVFRGSELVQDIIRHDNNIEQFFTKDMMHRLIPKLHVSDNIYKKAFLMSYGYFVYQELVHG